MIEEELIKRFSYHAPTPEKVKQHERIRAAALEFAKIVVANTPISREQSLALTHIEEAMYSANAAIARRRPG